MTEPEPNWQECIRCKGRCYYQDCPTGGWWVHERHPADGHDADPGLDLGPLTS